MASTSSLHGLPADQRPRERMRDHGAVALTDTELVALLIGTGHAGVNAIDLAGKLLQKHGGVAGLQRTDVTTLIREPGLGDAKATRLVAALALATRAMNGEDVRPLITCSSDVGRIVESRFADLRRERTVLVVCGTRNRVIDVVVLSDGAAHTTTFPVRELLAEVLRRDGVAFALAHNHPGGDPTPTEVDRRTTTALRGAAAGVGLRLLDHIVLAGSEWRSVTASR
ncbi:DNA repair protein RadC [Tersicoccus sp. MR15.9]|uniref:JAB domain-containing protein n=1 Tax=Tersicoccus mangrovi TaxID=3121635 RepID=UPI002FE67159